jgi:ABC-type iron transport system FetAB ATPase subunit
VAVMPSESLVIIGGSGTGKSVTLKCILGLIPIDAGSIKVDGSSTVYPLTVAVVDEFTSVVDRNVAKIASAAIAKYIRKTTKQFVAVSCHEDISEWLEPDWIYEPNLFSK